jgi:hypothetical protein
MKKGKGTFTISIQSISRICNHETHQTQHLSTTGRSTLSSSGVRERALGFVPRSSSHTIVSTLNKKRAPKKGEW